MAKFRIDYALSDGQWVSRVVEARNAGEAREKVRRQEEAHPLPAVRSKSPLARQMKKYPRLARAVCSHDKHAMGCAHGTDDGDVPEHPAHEKAREYRRAFVAHQRARGKADRRGTNHVHPPGPRKCPKCGV